MQRHSRNFELLMIGICIACIVVAVIIAKATEWGVTTRPSICLACIVLLVIARHRVA